MSSKIKGSLSGLDRVRFRGTIRWLSSLQGMGAYLGTMKILLKDFTDWDKARTTEIDVIRGEFAINGFRNRDLRPFLFDDVQTAAELTA